jgi:hypothetical protein
MACEHTVKLFAYDQLKVATKVKGAELRAMRNALHRALRADTPEEERSRAALCADHAAYSRARNAKRQQLQRELGGWGAVIEAELVEAGYPPIAPEDLAVPEEEFVMSYMLTQIEMELSLRTDYDSVSEATKAMTMEMQQGIREFDETEKKVLQLPATLLRAPYVCFIFGRCVYAVRLQGVVEDGSWYNKHRETLERHEGALHTTLTKVRNRMNEGYQL